MIPESWFFCTKPAWGTAGKGWTRLESARFLLMIRGYQGHTPQFGTGCYIDISAQILGDVVVGDNASVWMNAVIRGDVNSIRVGSHSNVQDCAVLHGQRNLYKVTVGDWVTIGHNATVHGCTIEDECLIGIGARVLNDCRIGTGSIIAAGAVVPEHTVVPPRTLWAGVPARQRRDLTDADHEMILQYARNYIDYTAIYLAETV
jgi:carbonic anhydrase/acetyltransferase-like protein (isoleucine patch superfamily)